MMLRGQKAPEGTDIGLEVTESGQASEVTSGVEPGQEHFAEGNLKLH